MENNNAIKIIGIGDSVKNIFDKLIAFDIAETCFISNNQIILQESSKGKKFGLSIEKSLTPYLEKELKGSKIAVVVTDNSVRNIEWTSKVLEIIRNEGIITLCLIAETHSGKGYEEVKKILLKNSNFIMLPGNNVITSINNIIQSIIELVTESALIKIDIDDLCILSVPGQILVCSAVASGENMAVNAASDVLKQIKELLPEHTKIDDIILYFMCGKDLLVLEVSSGIEIISELLKSTCETLFGLMIDEEYTNKVKIIAIVNSYYE